MAVFLPQIAQTNQHMGMLIRDDTVPCDNRWDDRAGLNVASCEATFGTILKKTRITPAEYQQVAACLSKLRQIMADPRLNHCLSEEYPESRAAYIQAEKRLADFLQAHTYAASGSTAAPSAATEERNSLPLILLGVAAIWWFSQKGKQ